MWDVAWNVLVVAILAGVALLFIVDAVSQPTVWARVAAFVTIAAGIVAGLESLLRGTFDAPAGPLRVRLELTSHGRRWTRRTPRLPVLVTVSTRAGGDHLAVEFESRLR